MSPDPSVMPPHLSLASSANLPSAPSSSKLKRFSLVARPSSLDLEHQNIVRSAPSTPDAEKRPMRGSSVGTRSSLSYSPAPSSSRRPHGDERDWRERDFEDGLDAAPLGSGHITYNGHDDILAEKRDVQTFMDKHAELLRLIAHKEGRVNDLRQELQLQESSLEVLKARWTDLISHSVHSPNQSPLIPSVTSQPRTRQLQSLSSSSTSPIHTSLATIDEPGDAQGLGIEKVLSDLAKHTEEYISPEVLEGGKKFLGNLWRTVEAAAGGTVPGQPSGESLSGRTVDQGASTLDEQDRRGHLGTGFDLSGIGQILSPWNAQPSHKPLSPSPLARTCSPPSTLLLSGPSSQS